MTKFHLLAVIQTVSIKLSFLEIFCQLLWFVDQFNLYFSSLACMQSWLDLYRSKVLERRCKAVWKIEIFQNSHTCKNNSASYMYAGRLFPAWPLNSVTGILCVICTGSNLNVTVCKLVSKILNMFWVQVATFKSILECDFPLSLLTGSSDQLCWWGTSDSCHAKPCWLWHHPCPNRCL